MSSLVSVTNLHSSTAQEIVNWVTTADGCVHTANTVLANLFRFVESRDCRQLAANSVHSTHQRRDSTPQLSRVGVGSVYWAKESTAGGSVTTRISETECLKSIHVHAARPCAVYTKALTADKATEARRIKQHVRMY